MTDIVDRAAELEAALREDALKRQRERSKLGGASATACADCGDDIPQERRAAAPGCRRCIECEGIAEMRGRLHG